MTGPEIAAVAQRFIGTHELAGDVRNNPFIVWALSLCGLPDVADEVPWCSAFVNAIAFTLGLERTHNAAARSWLGAGVEIQPALAMPGDVVILTRGSGRQPDASVRSAPGHVGIFLNRHNGDVQIVGGNQGDAVSIASFPVADVLGVRRLRNA